jgi:hypothetical protein
MAATIPVPINRIPAVAGSGNPVDVPPVLGSVVVSAPGLLSALAVAVGVALAVDEALAVVEAIAVDEALAVGLATTSSPVGLSSKPRSPPRSSPPRSSPVGLSSWANAAGAKTSAASIIANSSIKDLRIFFLSALSLHDCSSLTFR